MAVAQKVGRGMKTGMKTPALLLLAALSAPAAAGAMTYYVTIAGLGGGPVYAPRQTGKAGRSPGGDSDRARQLRRARLQIQHPGCGPDGDGTGRPAGSCTGAAPTGSEYDQFERRIDRAVAASQPHRDRRHQDAVRKERHQLRALLRRSVARTGGGHG